MSALYSAHIRARQIEEDFRKALAEEGLLDTYLAGLGTASSNQMDSVLGVKKAKAASNRAGDALGLGLGGLAVLTGIVAAVMSLAPKSSLKDDSESGRRFAEVQALILCQNAIRQTARDPQKAEIPYVRSLANTGAFRFEWNGETALIRMKNGLGLDVAVRAICVVSPSGQTVEKLTIDQ